MKKIILLSGLLLLGLSTVNAQDRIGTTSREKHILKLVNELPEVVKENKLRKALHLTIFLRAYIQIPPTKTDKYYYVSISEEKGERLFTYDWYKVDSLTYAIKYYDMISDKTMSLKEWRIEKKLQAKRKASS